MTQRRAAMCGLILLGGVVLGCSREGARQAEGSDTVGLPMPSAIALRPTPGMRDPDAADARAPQLRDTMIGDSVQLEVVVQAGDQINALQPPVLTTDDGRRLVFGGPAITTDSAYFVGAVTTTVARDALPLRGRLVTSYCRAEEKLCRSATRDVVIE